MKFDSVGFSNLNKIFWPGLKITKGDLIKYYLDIAPYILPHLKNRPESLRRFPDGINGESFYQKNFLEAPKWVKQTVIADREQINYLLCNDEFSLAYLINLGCIDLNPWLSRVDKLDYPDFLVIDLDPLEVNFALVVDAALATKKVCDDLGLFCLAKTSGMTGIHIYIPLGAKYDYSLVVKFAEVIANLVHRELPETTSIERMPSKRQGKVYIDFLQNFRGQTVASVYSVRPNENASVSTPLFWRELTHDLDPAQFNIYNLRSRLKKYGDIFKPVLTTSNDMAKALGKIRD